MVVEEKVETAALNLIKVRGKQKCYSSDLEGQEIWGNLGNNFGFGLQNKNVR